MNGAEAAHPVGTRVAREACPALPRPRPRSAPSGSGSTGGSARICSIAGSEAMIRTEDGSSTPLPYQWSPSPWVLKSRTDRGPGRRRGTGSISASIARGQALVPERVDEQRLAVADDQAGVRLPESAVRLHPGPGPGADLDEPAVEGDRVAEWSCLSRSSFPSSGAARCRPAAKLSAPVGSPAPVASPADMSGESGGRPRSPPGAPGGRAARRRVLAVRRCGGGRGDGRARHLDAPGGAPRSSGSRAPRPPTLPTWSPGSAAPATYAAAARRPPRHGDLPRLPSADGSGRRAAVRLRDDRHEGRGRTVPRPPEGALRGARTDFAEVALLLVNDEEFRTEPFATGRASRASTPASASRAASGPSTATRRSSCVARRRRRSGSTPPGPAAHAGANPDAGRSALLALSTLAARAARRAPRPGRCRGALSVVPTMMRSGEGINVVPGTGELHGRHAGRRRGELRAGDRVDPGRDRRRPADRRAAAALARDGHGEAPRPSRSGSPAELLGRQIVGASRGGASDASNLAPHVPLAIDGLGPLGASAHSPEEHLLVDSLRDRAEVALALAGALLSGEVT